MDIVMALLLTMLVLIIFIGIMVRTCTTERDELLDKVERLETHLKDIDNKLDRLI